jgi:hypothetical protein
MHDSFSAFFGRESEVLRVDGLHLDGDTDHTIACRAKDVPTTFVFDVIQEIRLIIHFELQLLILRLHEFFDVSRGANSAPPLPSDR